MMSWASTAYRSCPCLSLTSADLLCDDPKALAAAEHLPVRSTLDTWDLYTNFDFVCVFVWIKGDDDDNDDDDDDSDLILDILDIDTSPQRGSTCTFTYGERGREGEIQTFTFFFVSGSHCNQEKPHRGNNTYSVLK